MTIQFFARGIPKAQPRPRAFARNFGGKWQARVYDAATAEGWKSQVADAAKLYVPTQPITGPVRVDLTFYFPRPKSHFRTGKHADELKPDAPNYHTSKPDRDNCEKAVTDCLKQLGFFADDSQICRGEPSKYYVGPLMNPGCWIVINTLDDTAEVPAT